MADITTRKVDSGEDGMRLDRWFRAHYPAVPNARLQKLLRTGQVRLDGGRVKASTRVAAGQAIRVPPLGETDAGQSEAPPRRGLAESDRALLASMTLYEDDELLILNKPSGIAVQGGTKTTRHIDGMLEGLSDDPDRRPRLVHRLDRDTSGVLVVAKRRAIAAKMGRMFQTRTVRKIYWAIVKGVPAPPQGKIDAALVKASSPDGDRVRKAGPGEQEIAQSAVTHYAVIDRAGRKVSWMSLKPVTGRQHQLRAHLAIIGHPILGDGKYDGDKDMPGGIDKRLHLHARRVSFSHPARPDRTVDVTAPLPDHLLRSFAAFGFDSGAAEAMPDRDGGDKGG